LYFLFSAREYPFYFFAATEILHPHVSTDFYDEMRWDWVNEAFAVSAQEMCPNDIHRMHFLKNDE